MGLIKAFTGALGGQFADQWLDYIMPPAMSDHVLAGKGSPKGTNAGRGSNAAGSENIISNGSKILVPEGTAAVFVQDGGITSMTAEAGGYTWTSENDTMSRQRGGLAMALILATVASPPHIRRMSASAENSAVAAELAG